MKNQSVMKHMFSEVPNAEIQRSSFNRSHGLKTTFDAGLLIPILVDEALPGDTFNVNMTGFARLATPINPTMDNLFMETFFFAVPNRLIWDNWQKFNGEQTNPGDSIDFTVPVNALPSVVAEGSLSDYFGIPIGVSLEYNTLHHRAYGLIWNEWFRDQNLQNSITVKTDDGPDTLGTDVPVNPLRRGKRHDYFTSCLPWPQKGDSVSIPLGTSAPVNTTNQNIDLVGASEGINRNPFVDQSTNNNIYLSGFAGPGDQALRFGTTSGLQADLTSATAATINQLRQAFQIQKLMERDARGGTRYTEIIKSHFGVTSPDQRLQRPEFLGGGSSMVNMQQVEQTSSTDATTPQGNLSAYGTASLHNHGFTKSFTEHCVIIGLVNVRADLTYQQGINRMFKRQTRYDYYWPALAHIGEQAVRSEEIFADGTAIDRTVFGYQERYAEYRYKPSTITSRFRSNAALPLHSWHYSQDFASRPLLNDSFIQDNPPIDRTIAVPSEPHFIFDAHFNMKCARPMPVYGVPGNMDRF